MNTSDTTLHLQCSSHLLHVKHKLPKLAELAIAHVSDWWIIMVTDVYITLQLFTAA